EVADGVAEFLVAAPAERDGAVSTAGSGGGGDAGEAGERFGVGEPVAAVADLGDEGGGADGGAAGQGTEDVGVGVGVEQFVEASLELVELGSQGAEGGDVGEGDGAAGVAIFAADAPSGGLEPGEQLGGVFAAAVAVGVQPGGEPLGRQPGGAGFGGE